MIIPTIIRLYRCLLFQCCS